MSYTKKIIDGYFEKSVTYDKRLAYKPYASAGVMYRKNDMDSDCYTLVSYTTPILSLYSFFKSDINRQFLVVGHVNYSRTTITHVNAFLREYVPGVSYYDCKEIWQNNDKVMAINLKTGEIIDADKVYEFFERGYND